MKRKTQAWILANCAAAIGAACTVKFARYGGDGIWLGLAIVNWFLVYANVRIAMRCNDTDGEGKP